jgi:hypothetical protein
MMRPGPPGGRTALQATLWPPGQRSERGLVAQHFEPPSTRPSLRVAPQLVTDAHQVSLLVAAELVGCDSDVKHSGVLIGRLESVPASLITELDAAMKPLPWDP